MNIANVQMLDITAPDELVEVEVDAARRVLYVHVDGVTVLRICRIPNLFDVKLKDGYGREETRTFPKVSQGTKP